MAAAREGEANPVKLRPSLCARRGIGHRIWIRFIVSGVMCSRADEPAEALNDPWPPGSKAVVLTHVGMASLPQTLALSLIGKKVRYGGSPLGIVVRVTARNAVLHDRRVGGRRGHHRDDAVCHVENGLQTAFPLG